MKLRSQACNLTCEQIYSLIQVHQHRHRYFRPHTHFSLIINAFPGRGQQTSWVDELGVMNLNRLHRSKASRARNSISLSKFQCLDWIIPDVFQIFAILLPRMSFLLEPTAKCWHRSCHTYYYGASLYCHKYLIACLIFSNCWWTPMFEQCVCTFLDVRITHITPEPNFLFNYRMLVELM